MKLYGISEKVLRSIVNIVSADYDKNIVFKKEPEKSGNAINFSLRILDCNKKGARRSNTGRKIPAACWHAHRDIMELIFLWNPSARLVSILADYRGEKDFLESFPGTGSTNFGSIAVPIRADRACNCETHEIVRAHNEIVHKLVNNPVHVFGKCS